jgi:glutamine cyclotransferase
MDTIDSMLKIIKPHAKKTRPIGLLFLVIPVVLLQAAILSTAAESSFYSVLSGGVPTFVYEIVKSYPHDSQAFTQGLVYEGDGLFLEGTGLYGGSSLRRVELETGRVLQKTDLNKSLFGEGVALWKDRIVQLTWQSGLGLVYDRVNLEKIGNFNYSSEGWGITSDNHSLIMSDGSNVLHILDPESFAETGKIAVTSNGSPLGSLNELEYINGKIYANVWPTYWIAIISPDTGNVLGRINLAGILKKNETGGKKVDVPNGIAYDDRDNRLFITGKLWPRLYEIKLVPEKK